MRPTKLLTDQLGPLLVADTAVLAAATANKVGLITAPFLATIETVMADLTISAHADLLPLAGVVGTQNESNDPVNGNILAEIKAPAGGFRWETGVGFTGPITVYGFAFGNNAMTTLFGCVAFANPRTLDGPNQTIIAPSLYYRIDPTKIV